MEYQVSIQNSILNNKYIDNNPLTTFKMNDSMLYFFIVLYFIPRWKNKIEKQFLLQALKGGEWKLIFPNVSRTDCFIIALKINIPEVE